MDRVPGRMAESVLRLFARGEAFDSDGFVSFFTDKPFYQFGNWEPCLDRPAIRASVAAFFGAVEALYHDVRNLCEVGDTVFVEMDVTYWRKDGSSVTLPCADIVRFAGDKVQELRIFMDANPVGNPAMPVSKTASVFTVSEGKRLSPPGLMRQFFAEHKEGVERAAKGFAPKWSIAGPRWPTRPKGDIVRDMQRTFFTGEWEAFRALFADDVYFRVGNVIEATGPQGVADSMKDLVTNRLQMTRVNLRKAWETENVCISEFEMEGERKRDRKVVNFPCLDIYRFEGNKVVDWRVKPIEPTMVAERQMGARPPKAISSHTAGGGGGGLSIMQAFQGALREGNWQRAGSFLAPDVVLRVANRPVVKGPQALFAELGDVFKRLRPTGATFTEVWEFDDGLVVDLVVQGTRVSDNRAVEYPCVEIFQFADGKIKDWRIYPVEMSLLAPES